MNPLIQDLTERQLGQKVSLAQIVPQTRAEGPGERFAIWFQGCPFRCVGCCNPEMLRFEGGQQTTVGDILDQLKQTQVRAPELEGITLLGGEPFAQATAAAAIARGTKSLGLSVMVFTGHRMEELENDSAEDVEDLLQRIDLLVDGRYEQDQPDTKRRWIGSANQKVFYLTNRYSPTDSYWTEPDTLEIRLENQTLTINGFPALSAMGLWRRVSRKTSSSSEMARQQNAIAADDK